MLKVNNITALFTSLNQQNESVRPDLSEDSVSSLVDTWITVRDMEGTGERNRGIYIIKSRGMSHSNQVREFIITANGIKLLDIEFGPNGILTGLARKTNQLNRKVSELKLKNELNRKDREIVRKRNILEATIAALRNEFESAQEELNILKANEELQGTLNEPTNTQKKKK